MNHEEKTERTMQSLQSIKKAQAPAFLWTRIEARLHQPLVAVIQPRWAFALVACITVLTVINVRLVFFDASSPVKDNAALDHYAKQMEMTGTYIDYEAYE